MGTEKTVKVGKNLIAQLKKELLQLKEKYEDQDNKYPEMVEINKKYW